MSDEVWANEVYQPDGSEVQDDAGVLDPEDTLDDRGVTPAIDEGYSPPERPLEVERTGITVSEQRRGETLDQRLAEEEPDVGEAMGDGIGDLPGGNGELIDREVGDARSGRLVAADEGVPHGLEQADDTAAFDAGIAGGAASAEEAAVRIVDELEGPEPEDI
ncbi:DUF5709 domain-containing protein [Streptantibioticus ferralitis]|uniref:DUF5709 domain-containing protein n=1 Tax=Streptantibioticus ferralitis TaxID=236510 RepID=A0ABT5YYK0_9ACTN|nr:DUF5709 domain-containing protein [Streptantibioticus ferralitis]MDF2256671.1 DUF5709 domain-containing protein [Streptantibioticus ferralitis]